MAEAQRKNIYISEENMETYSKAEQFSQQQGVSMSALIIEALDKYLKEKEAIDQTITLVIKTHGLTGVFDIKQVKFTGQEVLTTGRISTEVSSPFHFTSSKELENDDYLAHQYVFYKTSKGKILVYVKQMHLREEDMDEEGYFTDEVLVDEETLYKVFDNLPLMLSVITDLSLETLDSLALAFAEVEFLDI